jgi:GNAT superfamily N-acetyltransferase
VSSQAWVAEPHEAETVARLLCDFRDHTGRDWPSDNAFLAAVERLIERNDTEYLLGAPDDDSPPAGVAQLRYRYGIWLAAEDCWLEDVFVRDDARGKGVGSALVELAMTRARERSCRRIELDASEGNEAALALYAKFGLTPHSKGDPEHRDLLLGARLPENDDD